MRRAKVISGELEHDNMILLESVADVIEYDKKIRASFIKEAAQDVIHASKRNFLGHCDTPLGNIAHGISVATGKGELKCLTDLCNDVFKSQLLDALNGSVLAVNHNGGYFKIKETDEIIELKEFKFTEKDIRIIKYEGGTHFYAKIGNEEVVDDYDGSTKWRTHDYAYKTAL